MPPIFRVILGWISFREGTRPDPVARSGEPYPTIELNCRPPTTLDMRANLTTQARLGFLAQGRAELRLGLLGSHVEVELPERPAGSGVIVGHLSDLLYRLEMAHPLLG